MLNTAIKFLALCPTVDVRYSGSTLSAYGYLSEHQDTHGPAIWVDGEGRVFEDCGIINGNTYTGERTPPSRVRP